MTDWKYDADDSTVSKAKNTTTRARVKVKNLARWAAFGVVLVAAWHLLAPFAGLPAWQAYAAVAPTIPVTAGLDNTIMDAGHAVVLAVAAFIAWKI